jgi:hypothetical protein
MLREYNPVIGFHSLLNFLKLYHAKLIFKKLSLLISLLIIKPTTNGNLNSQNITEKTVLLTT